MDILTKAVDHPSAWRGAEIADDPSWRITLTPAMCAEIDAALRAVQARGLGPGAFEAADFPLPTVEPLLLRCRHDVLEGRGFVVLRGLPVERYGLDEVKTIYWGFGLRLGFAVVQNLAGDLVAQIVDKGRDVNQLGVKPSETNAEQRPHSDPADVVALLCINRAKEGGVSSIASSIAIYNEILATHPEHLPPLYRGFHHDLRGDAGPDNPAGVTPQPIPIYRCRDGVLSCIFNASTIKEAERRMGRPYPAGEMEAVDHMVALARSRTFRLDMEFQPGDIQILNNYTVMHWRSAFVDDPANKRLLLRLWLDVPGGRPVDPEMARGYITGAKTGTRTPSPQPAV